MHFLNNFFVLEPHKGHKREKNEMKLKGIKNTQSLIMMQILPLKLSNFTNLQYNWIGNKNDTKQTLLK